MRLRHPLWVPLAALAVAACVDTQAPEQTPSVPSVANRTSLPVVSTMQVTAAGATANLASAFTITLRFINPPTASQLAAFQIAAAKWQSIILGDLPDASGSIKARTCDKSIATPSFKGSIDDILIDVLLQPIDGPGGVLGAAGPCILNPDNLPLYGVMFFDTNDLALLEQLNILDETVVHEMGHVLGFGSLWNVGRNLLQGTTADPRFVGPNGIAGYHDVGGKGASVPVEEEFGPGTARSHWDEQTFDEELMTGFITSGESPLSVMTIGAMQDLGYTVDPAADDKYHVSGRQERVAAAAISGPQIDLAGRERLLLPVAVVQ